jgi:NAD(P)-dependent dehydrogenase (short-subunit alcohol dehydrogenase family)
MIQAGIANITANLAQMLAEKGIRANSVAPGPVWTPLTPAGQPMVPAATGALHGLTLPSGCTVRTW